MELMKHQKDVLTATNDKNRVAYYLDMGLGKTFVGGEKAVSLGKSILLICQKSKIDDWINHFLDNYNDINPCDLTKVKEKDLKAFLETSLRYQGEAHAWKVSVWIINYELAWRRKELSQLTDFTLMLDESSLIRNETCKQAKFILNKLHPSNVILLSGTLCNGKYELLWSQCNLLGWNISKKLFYRQYMMYELDGDGYPQIVGYKNVERLKSKLRSYGAVFMKTEEVLDLPQQTFINVDVAEIPEYKKFKKDSIVTIDNETLVGDTTLTKLLYSRMLCSVYHKGKLEAFEDLLESTNDRLIVFYNFNNELRQLEDVCIKLNKPVSIVNGFEKDLSCYNEYDNAVVLVQYQAGAYGLNLQKANKIIYFSPPLSSEAFEQSKKRIHRIGQDQACFYYQLRTGIEHHIYQVLEMRKDYTDELFKEGVK